ncbi:hypothetical protein MtrunA17_Chr6g0462251 [Medicago truncatula]|uniref:Transmembrane protein n=1 Tax=Medicago truncatula TaxID=3880 RepID=A0A396HEA0_MEDTR|nr:hypothetical protein MtrunA17_Chr6g0462251 [Medicago truncatula]
MLMYNVFIFVKVMHFLSSRFIYVETFLIKILFGLFFTREKEKRIYFNSF